MAKILIIVPTRDRPHRLKEFLQSYRDVCEGHCDILVGIDDDQFQMYKPVLDSFNATERFVRSVLIGGEPREFVEKINLMAKWEYRDYDYFYVLGDDFVFENYFETKFLKQAKNFKFPIFYANDGFQGIALPTAAFMSTQIFSALGYIAPPSLLHMYCDNVWKAWGEVVGGLKYFSDIRVTHNHFAVKSEVMDKSYLKSNSKAVYDRDKKAFDNYMKNGFEKDINKLLDSLHEEKN